MKKIILAAAMALLATSASAQSAAYAPEDGLPRSQSSGTAISGYLAEYKLTLSRQICNLQIKTTKRTLTEDEQELLAWLTGQLARITGQYDAIGQ
jgi:opacity protein-like surface antigen